MVSKMTSRLLCLALVARLFGVVPAAPPAPATPLTAISLTGGAYTQDFNTLASSGTSSVVPEGWAFSESGSNANAIYTAGTGSLATGDTYSYGAASSTERAFGGVLSGSLATTIGAEFQNNTGATITSLAVSYTCEQWRLGATGRVDRLDFQVSTDATSLTTGSWINLDSLDCSSTITSGSVGAVDGNNSANRTAVSDTIAGLSIATTSIFWLRWMDVNASGSDDGLSVDDFRLTPATPTAITLSEFYAEQVADYVLVTWETASELENRGFNLYRGTSLAGPLGQLNATLIPSQSQGNPGGFVYTWEDRADLIPGTTYFYWIEDVDVYNVATMHGPVSVDYTAPAVVTLTSLASTAVVGNNVSMAGLLEFLRGLWYTRLHRTGVAGVLL